MGLNSRGTQPLKLKRVVSFSYTLIPVHDSPLITQEAKKANRRDDLLRKASARSLRKTHSSPQPHPPPIRRGYVSFSVNLSPFGTLVCLFAQSKARSTPGWLPSFVTLCSSRPCLSVRGGRGRRSLFPGGTGGLEREPPNVPLVEESGGRRSVPSLCATHSLTHNSLPHSLPRQTARSSRGGATASSCAPAGRAARAAPSTSASTTRRVRPATRAPC